MISYDYENEARRDGFSVVAGVDEAGRGPLAGDVYAGAVILPDGFDVSELNDSKKLSAKKREKLYEKLTGDSAVIWAVGTATVQEIDEINILNAAFLAMKRAVDGLSVSPDLLLVDGNKAPQTGYPERTIIKGDALSYSIAAASIIAKVARDRYMARLAEEYPQYLFEKHKGYGTKLHYDMLLEHGVSPVHRKTFLKNLSEKHHG
ncbi:MAG: ribonuclease HII [Clostridia bacterium]|nr:ribonuclease HII [Clostridia bacterium]